MQIKLKRVVIIVAVSIGVFTILIASTGGWFWWRYMRATRDSLIEKSVTLSGDIVYQLDLQPKRRLKRDKILIGFMLQQKFTVVNLSDKSTNKIEYPGGSSIFLKVLCVDTDGVKHALYIEGYAPNKLFWGFAEAVPNKTKFKGLEITASDKITLANIVWIDYHPM